MTKPTILCLCNQLGHLPSNQILMQIIVAIGPRFFHKDIHDFEKTECSTSLMEIKGFLQCIAANKQQWCSLVAAASCGLVAACEFFVCKLSFAALSCSMFAALSCSNLAALICSNLAAPSCSNLAALSCSNLAALSCSNLAALCVQSV